MIRGVGIDMIEVERIRRLRQRHGERVLDRVLGPAERAGLHGDPDQYLASRFACKEAAVKALGTRSGIRWSDLEVLNLASGRPVLSCRGRAAELLAELGCRAHVSLSHLREHAVAIVILEDEV